MTPDPSSPPRKRGRPRPETPERPAEDGEVAATVTRPVERGEQR